MTRADFLFAARLTSGRDAGQRTAASCRNGALRICWIAPVDRCIVREFRTIVLIDARVLREIAGSNRGHALAETGIHWWMRSEIATTTLVALVKVNFCTSSDLI
jgi:hypothetical protein